MKGKNIQHLLDSIDKNDEYQDANDEYQDAYDGNLNNEDQDAYNWDLDTATKHKDENAETDTDN